MSDPQAHGWSRELRRHSEGTQLIEIDVMFVNDGAEL